jgi:hypothetical protein
MSLSDKRVRMDPATKINDCGECCIRKTINESTLHKASDKPST